MTISTISDRARNVKLGVIKRFGSILKCFICNTFDRMNLSVVIISLIHVPPLITKVCSVKTRENRLAVGRTVWLVREEPDLK